MKREKYIIVRCSEIEKMKFHELSIKKKTTVSKMVREMLTIKC